MPPRLPSSTETSWPDDASYLARMVALADEVTNAIPVGAPMSWRRVTYRAVLSAVLRDAVENETTGLDPEDADNLSRFVNDAAAAASAAGLEHRDDAFEVVLNALLEDWVENWDTPDEDEA
jgi:hypothetical protein